MAEASGIGQRIYDLRIEHDIQQGELAKAIGLHQSVLNRIEKGTRSARDYEITAIAAYFQVTSDYLLGLGNEASPATINMAHANAAESAYIPPASPAISCTESDFLHKYRQLDIRGKDAVQSTLEHELKYV